MEPRYPSASVDRRSAVKVTTDTRGRVTVLGVDETRLDLSNADALKKLFTDMLEQGNRFVIDMGPVRFLDTYGIGALLWCWMRLNSCQGELRVSSVSGPVRELLELVKVSDILEIRDSLERAIEELELEGDA